MNKCTLVVCILTMLIGLLIAFCVLLQKSSTVEIDSKSQIDLPSSITLETLGISYSFCKTPSCVIATSKLHRRLDLNVNPCDNFYNFACGTFVDETVINDRKKAYSTLSIVKDEIFEEVRQLVTSKITNNDISPFVSVKEFYKKCINRSEIDLLGTAPLFEVMNKFGSWPILDLNWNENGFHWQKTLDEFFEHGFNTNYLMEFYIGVDDRNTTKNIIHVSQPFQNDEYNDKYYDFLKEGLINEKIKAYYEYMVELTSMLGANKETNRIEMKQVLDFEIAINNISTSYEILRNVSLTYHYTTINELQQKYPYMDWLKFVRTRIPKEIAIDDTEEVLYFGIDYLTNFGDLIEVTPKRIVANYLFWRIVDLSVNYLSKKVRVVKLKFHQELSGTINLDEGWKNCVSESVANLKHAVSAMYTQQKTQIKDKYEAVKIVESLKETVKQLTDQSGWMQKAEKIAVYKMLNDVKMLVGFPNEYLNDTLLIEYYKDLIFEDNISYFNAILDMKKFSVAKEYTILRENVSDTKWESISDITLVSSRISTTDSFITIPVAYLRPPFYSASTQAYLNYGGLGVDAGYLFSYGVDNLMLSIKSTLYRNTTHCVVKKYEQYMKDVHNLTINAGDASRKLMSANGSFKVGYHSYKNWQQINRNLEQKLPGIDYTPEQLFWIASAQIYCSKNRPEELIRRAAVNEHALEQFRVIGSFQNLPEFSQDFNCSLGTYMNPVEKCQIF